MNLECYQNYEKLWKDIETKTEKEINFKFLVKKSKHPTKAIKDKLKSRFNEIFVKDKRPILTTESDQEGSKEKLELDMIPSKFQ